MSNQSWFRNPSLYVALQCRSTGGQCAFEESFPWPHPLLMLMIFLFLRFLCPGQHGRAHLRPRDGLQQWYPAAVLRPRHKRRLPVWKGEQLSSFCLFVCLFFPVNEWSKVSAGRVRCLRRSCFNFHSGWQQHPVLWDHWRGAVCPLPQHLLYQGAPERDGIHAQTRPGRQQVWNCEVVFHCVFYSWLSLVIFSSPVSSVSLENGFQSPLYGECRSEIAWVEVKKEMDWVYSCS